MSHSYHILAKQIISSFTSIKSRIRTRKICNLGLELNFFSRNSSVLKILLLMMGEYTKHLLWANVVLSRHAITLHFICFSKMQIIYST